MARPDYQFDERKWGVNTLAIETDSLTAKKLERIGVNLEQKKGSTENSRN